MTRRRLSDRELSRDGGLVELPASGFLLAALPMKIENGTGTPVRAVALIPPRRPGSRVPGDLTVLSNSGDH